MNSRLLIYGAYGYTGRLMVQRALERGWNPVAAGRSSEKLSAIAVADFCLKQGSLSGDQPGGYFTPGMLMGKSFGISLGKLNATYAISD